MSPSCLEWLKHMACSVRIQTGKLRTVCVCVHVCVFACACACVFQRSYHPSAPAQLAADKYRQWPVI